MTSLNQLLRQSARQQRAQRNHQAREVRQMLLQWRSPRPLETYDRMPLVRVS